MEKETFDDHKRKSLFNGTGLDYIRLRAEKHEEQYNMPEQAQHLRQLAQDIDEEIADLKAQIQRKDVALNGNAHIMQRLCGEIDSMKHRLSKAIDVTLQALSEEKEKYSNG